MIFSRLHYDPIISPRSEGLETSPIKADSSANDAFPTQLTTMKKRAMVFLHIFFYIFISYLLLIFVITLYGMRELDFDDHHHRSITPIPMTHQHILFVGDSLLGYPTEYRNLEMKLIDRLRDKGYYNISLTIIGPSGFTIANWVRDYNYTFSLKSTPNIVLFYSDSDCSTSIEYTYTPTQRKELHERFKTDLRSLLDIILSTGTYLIFSGPGVYGDEGFIGLPSRFSQKSYIWDIYRDLTQQICHEYNIPYINIRQQLINNIPWYWVWYCGYITQDGEHANERGTRILADIFTQAIAQRLDSLFNY